MIIQPQVTTSFKLSISGIDDSNLIELFEHQIVSCVHSLVENTISVTIEQPHNNNPNASEGFLFLLRTISTGHFRPTFNLMFADDNGNIDGPTIQYNHCICINHDSALHYGDMEPVTHTFTFKTENVTYEFLAPKRELEGPQINEDIIQQIINGKMPRGSKVTELPDAKPKDDPFETANML